MSDVLCPPKYCQMVHKIYEKSHLKRFAISVWPLNTPKVIKIATVSWAIYQFQLVARCNHLLHSF